MLLTIELWTKYWMKGLCLMSPGDTMSWSPQYWLWMSASPCVIVICVSPCDNYPGQRPWGPQCGLGNGHRGNVMSSNVVQDLINDQQTSQSMSSRDHTQDGICVSFVWVPMMIIQHFLNVVASAAPNSRGQTVLIITNDDKKGSETKYNPPFV